MKLIFNFGFYIEIIVLERLIPKPVLDMVSTRESLDKLYSGFKSKRL